MESIKQSQRTAQQKIASETAAFLARGGQIQQIPLGHGEARPMTMAELNAKGLARGVPGKRK